jgi:hypothetical protein
METKEATTGTLHAGEWLDDHGWIVGHPCEGCVVGGLTSCCVAAETGRQQRCDTYPRARPRIREVAETFVIYGIEKPTAEARQLAGIIAG